MKVLGTSLYASNGNGLNRRPPVSDTLELTPHCGSAEINSRRGVFSRKYGIHIFRNEKIQKSRICHFYILTIIVEYIDSCYTRF